MKHPNSLDLITVQEYIFGAFDEFGTPPKTHETHSMTTLPIAANSMIAADHSLEARLVVPTTLSSEGTVRRAGPEWLNIAAWGLPQPVEKEQPNGTKRQKTAGDEFERHCFAEASFTYNTRRLMSAGGRLYKDGADTGLSPADIEVGPRANLLLSYLGALAGVHIQGKVRKAGETVAALSLHSGGSRNTLESKLDLWGATEMIAQESGRPSPYISYYLPDVSLHSEARLAVARDPTWVAQTVTIDHFDDRKKTDAHTSGRSIITYNQTEFWGYCPTNAVESLGYFGLQYADGEETGGSYSIDVKKVTLGSPNRESYAKTPEEAREMLQPLYIAVSGLRRYKHTALSGK